MQKYATLVELEKCCQTHIFLQNFVLIQPRTSPPKNCKILQNFAKLSNFANPQPASAEADDVERPGGGLDLDEALDDLAHREVPAPVRVEHVEEQHVVRVADVHTRKQLPDLRADDPFF